MIILGGINMKTYERKSFPRMARDLKVMYDKGNLSFDNAVQRSFVWKNTSKDNRMSILIDSMMNERVSNSCNVL